MPRVAREMAAARFSLYKVTIGFVLQNKKKCDVHASLKMACEARCVLGRRLVRCEKGGVDAQTIAQVFCVVKSRLRSRYGQEMRVAVVGRRRGGGRSVGRCFRTRLPIAELTWLMWAADMKIGRRLTAEAQRARRNQNSLCALCVSAVSLVFIVRCAQPGMGDCYGDGP